MEAKEHIDMHLVIPECECILSQCRLSFIVDNHYESATALSTVSNNNFYRSRDVECHHNFRNLIR